MKFQSPRGTRDLLFEKAELFARMEVVCARIFRLYGYSMIRTPHFESVELFKRSIGEQTDIVEKEMFVFEDRGGRPLALRPEGTAPVARAYIENGLYSKGDVTRLYYMGPMFRAERPQAGRYREFWQAGAECFGISHPSTDAETILMLRDLLKNLLGKQSGSSQFTIHLNSLGCSKCRVDYKHTLEAFLEARKGKLCGNCQRRMKKNPLRVLDCKEDAELMSRAPSPADFLCPTCQEHFKSVQSFLNTASCAFTLSPRLVRGLDYYTGAVFEVTPPETSGGVTSGKLGSQNALAAGGRYDTLVSDLGGPETPAIGFAIGLDRVAEVLTQIPSPDAGEGQGEGEMTAFVVVLGPAATSVGFQKLAELRAAGVACPGFLPDKSLKAQMRSAGSSGARWAVILGDQELEEKAAMVKDLSNGSQKRVPFNDLVRFLTEAKPTGKTDARTI